MKNPLRYRTKGSLSEWEILELQEENREFWNKESEYRRKCIEKRRQFAPHRQKALVVLESIKANVN